MRSYTERYNTARQRGAKPLILVEVWTDKGARVFGKQTPSEEQAIQIDPVFIGENQVFIGSNAISFASSNEGAFEWEARVLNFGDFRQSLSENSENIVESLVEKAMESYTVAFDNADGKFTNLIFREQFLNYPLILKQGFDFPDFAYSDFIELFYGKIVSYDWDFLTFTITADQANKQVEPSDPTIDITKTYAMAVDGSGFTGASEEYKYTDMEDTFFTETTWSETFEVLIDSGGLGTDQVLGRLTEKTFDGVRWEVGIDSSNHVYLKYTDDVNTATPVYQTITTGFVVTSGRHSITVDFDAENGEIIISDGTGQSYTEAIPVNFEYLLKTGTSGSGAGQFDYILMEDVDTVDGSIYVCDAGNGRIQKFSSAGAYLIQWVIYAGTILRMGVCVNSDREVCVVDSGNDQVSIYSASGSLLRVFGTFGSGDGEFLEPSDIAQDLDGNYFVTDSGRKDVQKFTEAGTFLLKFGSSGTGDGQFNSNHSVVTDSNGYVYVTDIALGRVQKFDSDGNFVLKWAVPGVSSIRIDDNDRLITTRNVPDGVAIYNTSGVLQQSFAPSGSGDGQLLSPRGCAFDPATGAIWTSDDGNDRIQKFASIPIYPDFANHGDDTDIIIGLNFDGQIFSVNHNYEWRLLNEQDNTAVIFEDVVSFRDTTLDDGYWEEWGTIEEITSEVVEETQLTAFEEVILTTAGQYNNPSENQANLILPLPYGNLFEGSGSGVWVCPCIDTNNFVYCVAGWPILSIANGNSIQVSVNGVITSPVNYTFNESNNYEGLGNIATLTFSADQGDATITVIANGKETSPASGVLITNPVDVIEDWLDYCSEILGTATWQKDTTSFAQALADSTEYGYTCAGVIQSNNTVGFWLQSILNSFLGSFRFSPTGTLQIFFTPVIQQPEAFEWFDEHEEISLKVSETITNIINRVEINYAVAYTKIDRRFKDGGETSYFQTYDESNSESIQKYTAKVQTFNFDWTRNRATVMTIAGIILARYAESEIDIQYEGQDFKYMPLELGDVVQAAISLVHDADGNIVDDVFYELREKTQNLDDFTTSMLMRSIGLRLSFDAQNVYIGTSQIYIGDSQVKI